MTVAPRREFSSNQFSSTTTTTATIQRDGSSSSTMCLVVGENDELTSSQNDLQLQPSDSIILRNGRINEIRNIDNNGGVGVRTVRIVRFPRERKKVRWENGTVDNENMNKKSSKSCCIYHKPKNFGESSTESSYSESSLSDSSFSDCSGSDWGELRKATAKRLSSRHEAEANKFSLSSEVVTTSKVPGSSRANVKKKNSGDLKKESKKRSFELLSCNNDDHINNTSSSSKKR